MLRIDVRENRLRYAELFGKPVLFSSQPVQRDTVPEGWHCYDLRGAPRHPERPVTLEDKVGIDYAGTVLSPTPLKREGTKTRRLKDQIFTQEEISLEEFCQENNLEYPADTRKYIPRPASPDEDKAGLFFALGAEKDAELGCIGHVRIDFGRSGKDFYHTWFPRGPEALNSQEFKAELTEVVDELRKSVLQSLSDMSGYCYDHGGAITGGSLAQNYGYVVETDRYSYLLRCNPVRGDYQAYLTCFDRQIQEMSQGQGKELETEQVPDQGMTMGGM